MVGRASRAEGREIDIGFPEAADLYSACTMRTSCRPSSPDGSGVRWLRTQSEKYTSSGPNWSLLPTDFCVFFPSRVNVYSSPSAYSKAGSACCRDRGTAAPLRSVQLRGFSPSLSVDCLTRIVTLWPTTSRSTSRGSMPGSGTSRRHASSLARTWNDGDDGDAAVRLGRSLQNWSRRRSASRWKLNTSSNAVQRLKPNIFVNLLPES